MTCPFRNSRTPGSSTGGGDDGSAPSAAHAMKKKTAKSSGVFADIVTRRLRNRLRRVKRDSENGPLAGFARWHYTDSFGEITDGVARGGRTARGLLLGTGAGRRISLHDTLDRSPIRSVGLRQEPPRWP